MRLDFLLARKVVDVILFAIAANNSMRSCPASTLNLWKRRLANGGRSTRHAEIWVL